MTFDEYLLFLDGTIDGYPNRFKKHLKNELVKKGLAYEKSQIKMEDILQEHAVDITELHLSEQLKSCIKHNKKAVSVFEEWEFIKDYKYSTLFQTAEFDKLIEKINTRVDVLRENESQTLSASFDRPVTSLKESMIFIKFNLKFEAIHPINQSELLTKYPFIVVIHKDLGIIEFRFDALKRYFMPDLKDQNIYSALIKNMRDYFRSEFDCQLEPIDLNFIVTEAKKQGDIKLVAQYMKLANGGNAQLEVGNNQNYIIPFIGELKALLSEYNEELEKVQIVKEALEQFIFEKEEMSDYPWIEVLWENEIKTRSIHVKFIFNYMSNDYCLIQHYYSSVLIGMERMNHVIKFISEHRNDNKETI